MKKFLIFSSLFLLIFDGLTFITKGAESYNDLLEARRIAEEHPLKHQCGKIVIHYPDEKGLMDYGSAVLINSQTISSASHLFYDCRKTEPKCCFYFQNYAQEMYPIHPIRTLGPQRDSLNASDDLALYYLKTPLPCSFPIKIATDWPIPSRTESETLFSLSYGWFLESKDRYQIHNADGQYLYYKTNTYETFQNTYIQRFDADRVIRISLQNGTHRDVYVGKPGSSAQLFLHDSGSPWFRGNETNGYMLCGISSLGENVNPLKVEQDNLLHTLDFHWLNTPLNFKVFTLNQPYRFKNQLTAVAPYHKWIEQYVNNFQ